MCGRGTMSSIVIATFDGVRCRPGPPAAANGTVFAVDEVLPREAP